MYLYFDSKSETPELCESAEDAVDLLSIALDGTPDVYVTRITVTDPSGEILNTEEFSSMEDWENFDIDSFYDVFVALENGCEWEEECSNDRVLAIQRKKS
jgi:hypothetical protein